MYQYRLEFGHRACRHASGVLSIEGRPECLYSLFAGATAALEHQSDRDFSSTGPE